jgi:hypothetical protein
MAQAQLTQAQFPPRATASDLLKVARAVEKGYLNPVVPKRGEVGLLKRVLNRETIKDLRGIHTGREPIPVALDYIPPANPNTIVLPVPKKVAAVFPVSMTSSLMAQIRWVKNLLSYDSVEPQAQSNKRTSDEADLDEEGFVEQNFPPKERKRPRKP